MKPCSVYLFYSILYIFKCINMSLELWRNQRCCRVGKPTHLHLCCSCEHQWSSSKQYCTFVLKSWILKLRVLPVPSRLLVLVWNRPHEAACATLLRLVEVYEWLITVGQFIMMSWQVHSNLSCLHRFCANMTTAPRLTVLFRLARLEKLGGAVKLLYREEQFGESHHFLKGLNLCRLCCLFDCAAGNF